MMSEKMPPACCTAEPPTCELMWVAMSVEAVVIPDCMACPTIESLARLFIDDGFVFVSANCVFSSGSSCEAPFWIRYTFGIRDLDMGGASATGAAAGLAAAEAVPAEDPDAPPDEANIAFISFSVTPSFFK